MKYLVEESSGLVRGGYELPLQFSVSGHFVMDVPTSLGVTPSPAYSDLMASKIAAVRALHPALPNYFASEFLAGAGTDVDVTQSTFYTTGLFKRTSIMATASVKGRVRTPVQAIGTSFTKVYIQASYFTLAQKKSSGSSPAAADVLYDYDPSADAFVDPPTGVSVKLTDSSGTSLLTLTPGTEQSYSSGAISVRIEFQNTNSSGRIWLSDFIFLYG